MSRLLRRRRRRRFGVRPLPIRGAGTSMMQGTIVAKLIPAIMVKVRVRLGESDWYSGA